MDKKGNFVLKVDPNLPIPINLQIKEQMKWMIGMDIIKPGDLLPPVIQLSEQLDLNRNTINWVYSQLRDEGIVQMQKGRGTQVSHNVEVEMLRKKKTLYSFIEKTVEQAMEQGLDPLEVSQATFAYILLFGVTPQKNPQFLLIECREHDHFFYRAEIERIIGGPIKMIFLDELCSQKPEVEEILQHVDVLVTTLNHSEEVNKLIGARKPVVTIGANASIPLLMEIDKLKRGTKVGFVCIGLQGGQWMAKRVEEAGIQHIESVAVGLDDRKRLEQLIQSADRIYASSAVFNQLKSIEPAKVFHYPMKLEASSEQLLYDFKNK